MTKREKKSFAFKVIAFAFQQILLTALVLCVFAMFHHVILRLQQRETGAIGQTSVRQAVSVSHESERTIPIKPAASTMGADLTAEENTTDDSADFSQRFNDKFSEEIISDENGYRSPNVSISLTAYEHTDKYPDLSYYVADVYIKDIRSLSVVSPSHGTYAPGIKIFTENNAIIAMNGDSFIPTHEGLCVRDGNVVKSDWSRWDICVLGSDGTMHVYGPSEYTPEEILSGDPYQVWTFGPSLLDKEGGPLDTFNTSKALLGVHPRTAIGYYEPGHYCFVVVDGRQKGHSVGASMSTLAEIMSGLGCSVAYNLDGGASSMMVYNGENVNTPSAYREISDMIIITEPEVHQP